jgi:hypothetical protein
MDKLINILFESLEDREKNIQKWLDNLIDNAPGKDRGEKLQYLWDKDPRWGKVVKALRNFNRYKPPHPEAYKAKFQADHYYVRFGDIPKSGKSSNHVTGGFEKGISAYPVKWNTKRGMWELDTSQLSDIGLNTLDSLIGDFFDKKGRPIYLIQGQSLEDLGIHDDEPLLDLNKIKVIKKLNPEEIWIEHYGGNDWGNIDEVVGKVFLRENIEFDKGDTVMRIQTPKGEYRVRVFKFVRDGIVKYNYDINSPPDHYADYHGKKIGVGGTVHLGPASTNAEQIYAALADQLKKLGLPYTQALKLKVVDTNTPENKAFLDKLGTVIDDFKKEMQKPENQPKPFGAGPPEYSQWIRGEDIKNGRVKWVIENYGDFWIVIKWSASPRETMKASEFLKNYEQIISGKKAKGDYAREVFIRNEPFRGI